MASSVSTRPIFQFYSLALAVSALLEDESSLLQFAIPEPVLATWGDSRELAPVPRSNLREGSALFGYNPAEASYVLGLLSSGPRTPEQGDLCQRFAALEGTADFLDVGANVGKWTIPVARCLRSLNKGGRVVAIEGVQPIADYLESAIVQNAVSQNVELYNYSLGDGTTPGDVRTTTVDAILARGTVKVFAMRLALAGDIDRTLTGAQHLLQNAPCVLKIMVSGTSSEGKTNVIQVLEDAGYDVRTLTREISNIHEFNSILYRKDFDKCAAEFSEVRAFGSDTTSLFVNGSRAAGAGFFIQATPTSAEAGSRPGPQMVSYRMSGGLTVYGFTADQDPQISADLAQGKLWRSRESEEMCRLFKQVRGRADFLDVGANLGTWTLPLARCLRSMNRGGRVLAVEPVPDTLDNLAASVARNKLTNFVDLSAFALGDAEDNDAAAQLAIYVDPRNYSGASVMAKGEDAMTVWANLTSLDRMVAGLDARIFAMKISVAGYEGQVLRGARRLLAQRPPCVINVQLNRTALAQASVSVGELLGLLQDAGYEVFAASEGLPNANGMYLQKDFEGCAAKFKEVSPRPVGGHQLELAELPVILKEEIPTNGTNSSSNDQAQPLSKEAVTAALEAAGEMVEYRTKDGSVLYGFNASEDTFISGGLSHGRLWKSKESDEMCKQFRHMRGRADFVDVGANIGTWTIPMVRCLQAVGFGGRVIAVEGLPAMVDHLAASVAGNAATDSVDIYNYSVGYLPPGADSATNLILYEDPTNRGGTSAVVRSKDDQAVTTPLTTLDRILSDNRSQVFAMKLSLEGYEAHALSGARVLMSHRPPCVLSIELNRGYLAKAGVDLTKLVDFLVAAGYDIADPKSPKGPFLQADFEGCRARFGEATEEMLPGPSKAGAVTQLSRDTAGKARVRAAQATGLLPILHTPVGEEPVRAEVVPPVTPELVRATDLSEMVEYRMKEGFEIYGFDKTEDTFISGMLAKGRLWKSRESSDMCQYFKGVKGRADFLDVGANIGTWTVPMAQCLKSAGMGGRVLAVEGVPVIVDHLAASISSNGFTDSVDLYNYSVGLPGNETTSNITIYVDPTNKGGSSVLNVPDSAIPVLTSLTSLDRILTNSSAKVFGAKISVEGYEAHVLSGAKALLSQQPPCILNLDLNPKYMQKAGIETQDVLDYLSEAGYDIPSGSRTFKGMFLQKDFDACRARFGEAIEIPGQSPSASRVSRKEVTENVEVHADLPLELMTDDVLEGDNSTNAEGTPKPVSQEVINGLEQATPSMTAYRTRDGLLYYAFDKEEDEFISGLFSKGRTWRSREATEMCKLFRRVNGSVDFLDVGANIGTWTLPMGRCLQSRAMGGKVIAVEGVPSICDRLAASIAANGLTDLVDLYNYSAGYLSPGQSGAAANLTIFVDPTNKGGSSAVCQAVDSTPVTTSLTSLDEIIEASRGRIFGMKINVEGFEGHVLAGARRLLSQQPPCILQIELNKKYLAKAGVEEKDVQELLRDAGYETISKGLYLQSDFDLCRSRFGEAIDIPGNTPLPVASMRVDESDHIVVHADLPLELMTDELLVSDNSPAVQEDMPKPLANEVINSSQDAASSMVTYRTKDGLLYYGFNKSEDEFISGMFTKGRVWKSRESADMCDFFRRVNGTADFVDVGANIGTWAIPMGRCLQSLGFHGRILAVEGVPTITDHLAVSIAANNLTDTVELYNYSVGYLPPGHNHSSANLTVFVDPTNKGGSSAVNQADNAVLAETSLTSLDQIINSSKGRVFAMKISVEGYEGHVLAGARRLLSKQPPCVLQIELNKKYLAKAGVEEKDVQDFLRNAGYVSVSNALYLQSDFDRCRGRFGEAIELPGPDPVRDWQASGDLQVHRKAASEKKAPHAQPLTLVWTGESAIVDENRTVDKNSTVEEDSQVGSSELTRPVPLEQFHDPGPGFVAYRMRDNVTIFGFERSEDTFISGMLAKGRLWRSRESSEMCRYFQEVDGQADFLDVGANIGTWTVPMARCLQFVGLGGRVAAVEGVPLIAQHLAASISASNLDNVDLYDYSVGMETSSSAGRRNLTIYVDPTNKGGSSAVIEAVGSAAVTTKLTTLDDIFLAGGAKIFGMKMDVEGYEAHVLHGAQQFLLRAPPCVLNLELSKKSLLQAGADMQNVLAFLRDAGYDVPDTSSAPATVSGFYLQRDFEECRARFGKVRKHADTDDESYEQNVPSRHFTFEKQDAKERGVAGLVDVGYVHEPMPVPVEDMEQIVPEEKHMVEFDLGDGTTIIGFSEEEDSLVSGSLARKKLWRGQESAELCEMAKHLRGRADFLDVGAHVGTWSVPLGHCLQSLARGGRVIAVEGAAPIAERLQASIVTNRLQHTVEVYNYIVGDGLVKQNLIADANASEVEMFLDPDNVGGSSLVTQPDGAARVSAPMTTLDSIVSSAEAKVFAMKIDIEGFEGRALNGSKELLAHPPCILNIDLNKKQLSQAGTPLHDVVALLRRAGYDVEDKEASGSRQMFYQKDFLKCQEQFDEAQGLNTSDTSWVYATTPPPAARHPKQGGVEVMKLVDIGYVHFPNPVSLDELRSINPEERGMVEYKMKDGLVIYGYNKSEDTFVSGTLSKGRLWEARSSNDFCKSFKEVSGRADFLDVGANIGTWTMPIAKCIQTQGFAGKVVSIEGMPPIAEHLEAAVFRNNLTDTVDVYRYVVGDGYGVDDGTPHNQTDESNGTVTMSLDPTNKGGSSIVNQADNATSVTSFMTTLDAILANYDARIFGMKIDIEGYEGHALKGALKLLSTPPCIINIELNRQFLQRAGTPLEDVVAQLSAAGFDMPAYEKWPSLSSQMYYQKDFEACKARFAAADAPLSTSNLTEAELASEPVSGEP